MIHKKVKTRVKILSGWMEGPAAAAVVVVLLLLSIKGGKGKNKRVGRVWGCRASELLENSLRSFEFPFGNTKGL